MRFRTATPDDVPRLRELAERSHRLNTGDAGLALRVPELVNDRSWLVAVAEMSDRFGDYGLIGAALVECDPAGHPDAWLLRLLSVSCRVAGRDIPLALLRQVNLRARAAGRSNLIVQVTPQEANLELRILLRGAGLEPLESPEPGTGVLLARSTQADLPAVPWVTVHD
jgi:predicted enzyme involved in methoxymalonyl-ACP biosynthesis